MGEQSASRLEGDRYQHLYSWYVLLPLLDDDSPFSSAFVEHPEAGAADDVTLHPRPGTSVASRYVQVKWHVDYRDVYSLKGLTEPPAKGRSLLQKLFASWKTLREQGPVEVWLVSNWQADLELGRYLQGRDCRLTEAFFVEAPSGALKEARAQWQVHLGVEWDVLRGFCRDLCIRLGFASLAELEGLVDERMSARGLRQGVEPRAIALDGIREWIEVGGEAKRVDRLKLQAFIRARNLTAPRLDTPGLGLWVHGWVRREWRQPPAVELDWTQYFNRETRTVPHATFWRERLLPDLREARRRLAGRPEGTLIDFRGKVPLSAALAVGACFPEVGGDQFRVEQPTRGDIVLWRSDAKPSARVLRGREHEGNPRAKDLLVVFQLTGDASLDVERFESEQPGRFRAVLVLEPEDGPHDGSVTSEGDAVAFAVQARELIRRACVRWRASTTHLILYAPASCCLFLGQRLNAMGPVVAYERTVAGGYAPSLTVETG
ncbi:SAVED domain-containing protein [Corallococcus sp. BB11-1]|uniref:SAVED domain-containing protein n=1 Tax=Corallococcus sp. BB11-1 TaxID=2996783 RepID=UPI0010E9967B|nr:SAVED domain-containing protein [Corallococcus sp. BB11-1]MCY1036814.1 SAVED domain-containing protein [Corallococcus sp. BB11-1]RYZ18054.1 MAG: SAVED domain-containing protein [Myxococcaceae bacterium]